MKQTAKILDQVLGRGLKPAAPGFALGWVQDGKVVYKKAWGSASLELPAPFSTQSVINAGSMAKQFVAACIHHLEMKGKLSLDDPLLKHVLDLPKHFAPVRLRNLLWHTSGIRCYTTLFWWSGQWDKAVIPRDQVLALLRKQSQLDFKPGSRYRYGNSNYALLTEVLERVSKQDIGSLAHKVIFEPAGLKQTHFRMFPGKPIRQLSQGHWRRDWGFAVNSHLGATPGPSRLMTSLDDLLRWAVLWQKPPRWLRPLHARMQQQASLNDGSPVRYGSGLMHQSYRGLKMLRHDGFTAGCRCDISHFPEQGATLVALANRVDLSPTWKLRQAAEALWAPKMKPVRVWPKTGVDRAAGKPEGSAKLKARAGVYKEEGADRCMELKTVGKGLQCTTFLNNFNLKSDRPGGYAGQGSGAIFRLDFDAGGLRLLKQGKASHYKRLKPLKATPARAKPLLGRWTCPESGAETRFSLSKGKLWQHSVGWVDEVLCWGPGLYYVDQLLYRVSKGRLSMGCDDGWIDAIEWVKKGRRA